MEIILSSVLWFALFGGLFGIALAFFSKVFYVKTDEKVEAVRANLPGANCAGCGFSSCDACAAAIAEGKADINACTVADDAAHAAIAEVMGLEAKKSVRMRAQVMCSGTSDLARKKYEYDGAPDCISATRLSGGARECPYGCVGLGTCAAACKFNAIHIVNGVAAIDYNSCRGCGACVKACPKHIIDLIPFDARHWVGCRCLDRGALVRNYCDVGCIGCKICEKNCPVGAITVVDSVAKIDYEKCTGCGLCEEKCPRKIIWSGKAQSEDGIVRGNEDLRADFGRNTKIENEDK
ncbi:MAG: RnfABCDGE type electron transport complex subunit B [Clostridia bacterium]|nr:RnfABCDGE type electron transport complex subunit B [Clostridia bacterium]